ncbi:MAG: hypothetical protein AMJ79_11190 [Phycisphaerae bacterium SM23_30]|nr:MAG: hypothetical protein AMJ79_11190 [Phycisphaerae bacterium SM23_30]
MAVHFINAGDAVFIIIFVMIAAMVFGGVAGVVISADNIFALIAVVVWLWYLLQKKTPVSCPRSLGISINPIRASGMPWLACDASFGRNELKYGSVKRPYMIKF